MFKQWQHWRSPSSLLLARVLVISLLILFIVWQLHNHFETNRLQHRLLEQLAAVVLKNNAVIATKGPSKLSTISKMIPKVMPKELPETVAKTVLEIKASKIKPLTLVQVDLPPLTSLPSTPSIEASTSPKLGELKQRVSENKPHKNSAAKVKSISAMYQQLISDPSIDIEIAWPNNAGERQNTFSFLYQCIGMKFGVINEQANGKQKVIMAKGMNHDDNPASDWLRIAQGELASQEIQWLKQYSLNGTPVRLFPKSVDWQLSSLLTRQLNNTALTHFRARYKYQNHQLMLTNIQLNKHNVANDWVLIKNHCSI